MSLATTHRPSSTGKPRRVTDAMIAEILSWNATRKLNCPLIVDEKAAELGIARATLTILLHPQTFRATPIGSVSAR